MAGGRPAVALAGRWRKTVCPAGELLEHDTQLDPRVCHTDTLGYTEVAMATAALLGFELAPRVRDIENHTLYGSGQSLSSCSPTDG